MANDAQPWRGEPCTGQRMVLDGPLKDSNCCARLNLLGGVLTMERFIATLCAVILVVEVAEIWAGPVEEVTQIAGPRLKAFQEGDVDAFSAAFADNAVVNASSSAFRIEGKEAIRAYFTEFFQIYPRRRVFSRQSAMRAYNDDLVISNSYLVLNVTDQQGKVTAFQRRSSVAWTKLGGRWQIVDQHTSRLPVAP
jgi:uncharacterized protein (TIGR02246 family)